MTDQPKPTKEKSKDLLVELNGAFNNEASAPSVPATVDAVSADLTTLPEEGGGLSYRTAKPDEREKMDQIIAAIDLQKPDGIIALGQPQRDRLSKLADEVLDSLDPSVKMNFIQALKQLIDAVRSNSLDEMKEKLKGGALSRLFHPFRGEMNEKQMMKTIEKFSQNITQARKVIREMVDRLEVQKIELVKNYDRINLLGHEFTVAAQEMRIVRAATAEYIRRVATGENTILTDLADKAKSKRADDLQELQTARTSFNVLRNMDTELLTSIATFDMNVASMAFTRDANIQDRMQTAQALTNSVTRWKSQLAAYSVMMVETAAQQLLKTVDELDKQSIKNEVDLFEKLVNMTIDRAASGTNTMRAVMEGEVKVAALLEGVGEKVEAAFAQQEQDKKLMEKTMSDFRNRVVDVYASNPGGLLNPAPKSSGGTKPRP